MSLNDLSREVIGAAMRVHRHLGCGFLEIVYERALAVELQNRNLAFKRQTPFSVMFEGQLVGTFITDYVVENQLILELKASKGLTHACHSQLLNYLRASEIKLGLLLNFGTPSLQIKRVANSQQKQITGLTKSKPNLRKSTKSV